MPDFTATRAAEMTIAVLSGKGGAGKTLVSVNLAAAAAPSVYVDCDVEEPNGRLFFKPENVTSVPVEVLIPEVDGNKCTGCRACVDFCAFNALAFLRNKPYVFEEICHSCGGCSLICPTKAITERPKAIGIIERGATCGVEVLTGILNTGEESGVPIIKKLLRTLEADADTPVFIDCPPGSACTVMESIKDADFCVLTAEPTIFGAHNLAMVWELVQLMKKPCGVVLNKTLDGDNPAEQFCRERSIPILTRIPYDSSLGALNAIGQIAVLEDTKYRGVFTSLYETIREEAAR